MKAVLGPVAALCLAGSTVASATEVVNAGDADTDVLAMNNPGSIAEQYQQDRERKDYLFQFPGMNGIMEPWARARTRLDTQHGFKPTVSFTHLYQDASDTVGPEDSAAGYEVVVDGTWIFRGRDTQAPTQLGFEFLYRDFTSDIPPVALFQQVGSLYPTTVAFSEVDPTIGQLWIQHKFSGKWGFRAGKLFPVSAYDFFPLKNFRTDFVDGVHGANFIIPLPDRGLGGFVMYRPQPNVYLRAGFHDANADAEKAGFNSLFDEGELFKIFEVGFDPQLAPRQPGRPPPGDIHLSVWHQDEREDENLSVWGIAISASQRFGRFLPFLRYGYTDIDSDGILFRRSGSTLTAPTPLEHMINAGLAIDNIFGQANDRIGIGLTWARPNDGNLDNQGVLDVFYRINVTPQIAVTPILHVIKDPARNPDEDTVYVWRMVPIRVLVPSLSQLPKADIPDGA